MALKNWTPAIEVEARDLLKFGASLHSETLPQTNPNQRILTTALNVCQLPLPPPGSSALLTRHDWACSRKAWMLLP